MLAWTLFALAMIVNVVDLVWRYLDLQETRAQAAQQRDANVFAKL